VITVYGCLSGFVAPQQNPISGLCETVGKSQLPARFCHAAGTFSKQDEADFITFIL
jgi:hypothetical protein